MKAVGIILAGGNNDRMSALTQKRAIAAMPLAGSYRSVDFALSNMSNSGIKTVAVITQYSSRSLNQHLSSSTWWGIGRKQGGLYLFNPTITPENSNWYRGTADALAQNLDFLQERHESYVVIASGDGVYKMDFNAVLDAHVANEAEITVVCRPVGKDDDCKRFGIVEFDEDGRIRAWHEKSEEASGEYINCGIYVVRRRHLIRLLEECRREGGLDFVRDVLMKNVDSKRIMAYRHAGYWNNIASVESYYSCNMDFLNPALRKEFFADYPTIHTRVDDNPPAKFNENAMMHNSLCAGGSIVNGIVEDSVLFKKVYIGYGSHVKNCILLDDAYIDDGVVLENCIVEKHTRVEPGTVVKAAAGEIRILT